VGRGCVCVWVSVCVCGGGGLCPLLLSCVRLFDLCFCFECVLCCWLVFSVIIVRVVWLVPFLQSCSLFSMLVLLCVFHFVNEFVVYYWNVLGVWMFGPSFCVRCACSLFSFCSLEMVLLFYRLSLVVVSCTWFCSLCVVLGCCCGVLLFLLIRCSLTLVLFCVFVRVPCSSFWLLWFVIVRCPWTFMCYWY